jgi:hypothetical protein
MLKKGKKKLNELCSQKEDSSNLYPCKKCRNECVVDCIQCDECDEWFHYKCARLTEEEFTRLGSNTLRDFFCSRCVLLQLPFYLVRGTLTNTEITPNSSTNENCLVPVNCPEINSGLDIFQDLDITPTRDETNPNAKAPNAPCVAV